MTRFVNPVPQFIDAIGRPYSGGRLHVYETGTNIRKTTYSNDQQTIANTNPVVLDARGSLPNVFYNGIARVVFEDANGVQIWERDNVGSGGAFDNFGEWQNFIIYQLNDFAYRNGILYRSLANDNQANDPVSAPGNNTNWLEVRFTETFNAQRSYSIGDICRTTNGNLWRSLTNNNNTNPITDNGTNWRPAIEGLRVPELKTVVDRVQNEGTGIIQTGGGALTAQRINILTDTQTYTLPLANTVSANEFIDIELPDDYRNSQPIVEVSGTDEIEWSQANDTSITFDSGSSVSIRLYSNGSNRWKL